MMNQAESGTRATLRVDLIRTDGGTQVRQQLDDAAVKDYTRATQGNVLLPPVVVFHDGTAYWLADGFHRLAAARRAGPASRVRTRNRFMVRLPYLTWADWAWKE